MGGSPAEQDAVGLAWLTPTPAAVVALTDDVPPPRILRTDPGMVALALRVGRPGYDRFQFGGPLLLHSGLPASVARLLEIDPHGWPGEVVNSRPYVIGRFAAEVAAETARRSRSCPPDAARVAALLAPLGWYAALAVDPNLQPTDPGTPDAITRRLAARWGLPPWVAGVIGHLHLLPADADRAGAVGPLFRVVQAAVCLAEARHGSIGLTGCVAGHALDLAEDVARETADPSLPPANEDRPHTDPVLLRLLRQTAALRRQAGAATLAVAETRVDQLTRTLAAVRAEADDQLRTAKLAALVEVTAGASHEINNPLAVISGNAQLLADTEPDADRRRKLDAMVRNADRIRDLLRGLSQFARPADPKPATLDLDELVTEVVADLGCKRPVTIDCHHPLPPVPADPGQVATAVEHLVRNALEAAGPAGWVRVTLNRHPAGVAVCVEDSGPGPAADAVPHLFDPFFSGRTAGRGRGLGLSVAWRLATLNGGDVVYDPAPGGPTRFVLTLPATARVSAARRVA